MSVPDDLIQHHFPSFVDLFVVVAIPHFIEFAVALADQLLY